LTCHLHACGLYYLPFYTRYDIDESDSTTKNELHDLVTRPKHWGGFLIRPKLFEFWCDGKYRLHSRIQYTAINTDTDADADADRDHTHDNNSDTPRPMTMKCTCQPLQPKYTPDTYATIQQQQQQQEERSNAIREASNEQILNKLSLHAHSKPLTKDIKWLKQFLSP